MHSVPFASEIRMADIYMCVCVCVYCIVLYFVLEIITEWYWTRPESSYSKQYKNYSKSKQTHKSNIITYMYRSTQDTD
jgi:uncharacterized Fe-S cluster-containing radical SAM superfamily protein